MKNSSQPAAIQYIGIAGVSQDCVDSIERLIQNREAIESALLLTCDHDHGLLLSLHESDLIAVKCGFTSGYSGEGSRALGRVLRLLSGHNVATEEILVSRLLLSRLDNSSLTIGDIASIEATRPIRPTRIYDYIYAAYQSIPSLESLWPAFPKILPLSIIDKRIADLAMAFFERPNDVLLPDSDG